MACLSPMPTSGNAEFRGAPSFPFGYALLKLSRLESRTKPIERQKVDLTEMLSAVVATHQAYINEEG